MDPQPSATSIIAEKLPSQQEFADVLDSVFHLQADDGEGFDTSLIEVKEIASNDFQENFTLLFRAPADVNPQQSIYRLEHDELGAMDIFLVPIKRDESGSYLEAVFNLIKAVAA